MKTVDLRGILAVVGLIVTVVGCDGGTDLGSQMVLVAEPQNAESGEAVLYTLSATSPVGMITSSRIDFDGNGTWDETHSHSSASITTTFSHTFNRAALYTARAEILEGTTVLESRTTLVSITGPPAQEIRMTVTVLTQGQPECRITGPVWHEPGTSTFLLQGQTARLRLGTRFPGEIVDVTQTFTHSPTSGGNCLFTATLWADQTEMVSGSCSTGAANECVINLQGVVP